MDPQQALQTPVSPPPVQTPPTENATPPPAPKQSNKKTLLIVIGSVVLVLLLIGVGITILIGMMSSQNKAATTDDSLYYNREGYDPKDYGKTIGDPLALSMDKLGSPVNTSGGPIIYACNLIMIKELSEHKIYLDPRSDAKGVTRNYVDGVGKQNVETSEYTLPSSDEENNCSYSLQSSILSTILDITVYQPPFVAKGAIDDTIDRLYTKTDSINGLETYKYKDRGGSTLNQYMMRSGKSAVQVLFNGSKTDQDKQKEVLNIVAKNFANQQTNPKGPAEAVYDTPTFTKKYAKACDFISNDDIKSLTGSDASVFANEALASATGVAQTTDGKLYNSITTGCSRFNAGLGSGIGAGPFDQKLDVTMTSFNDEKGAKFYFVESGRDAKEKTMMSAGDEAFGYRDTADQNTVIMRKGRFIVEIVFDRTVQKNANLQETAAMTQKLTPYAQQVASKLESMQ